jgi:hypothetical protein
MAEKSNDDPSSEKIKRKGGKKYVAVIQNQS